MIGGRSEVHSNALPQTRLRIGEARLGSLSCRRVVTDASGTRFATSGPRLRDGQSERVGESAALYRRS